MPLTIHILHDNSLVDIEQGVEYGKRGDHHSKRLHKSEFQIVENCNSTNLV